MDKEKWWPRVRKLDQESGLDELLPQPKVTKACNSYLTSKTAILANEENKKNGPWAAGQKFEYSNRGLKGKDKASQKIDLSLPKLNDGSSFDTKIPLITTEVVLAAMEMDTVGKIRRDDEFILVFGKSISTRRANRKLQLYDRKCVS